ncbi:hypothetical protein GQ43DRAFT_133792 [Delitschia confertaspora ATCC 74209]|uniref:Protein YAE1 n=1 Tax=Delitschia confertaspora ATCC 74209 TaxID=1513339 RepID=A0A9P4JIS1_9PLEO|nr:hypothetical protein GQ43DRAFT_133792 [Delitschia confertaspora ATCC 74209]
MSLPSPTLNPTHFTATTMPPSPPSSTHNDDLDDIYGSTPTSPVLSAQNNSSAPAQDEILSDLPSRQRMIDTDAYREGLSANKGEFVQAGFDEGYSLGANIGLRVGYILGVLRGIRRAVQNYTEGVRQGAASLLDRAQEDLKIEEVCGSKYFDEEGIFKWEVKGKEEEVTFAEVAQSHPVIVEWENKVGEMVRRWGVDLEALARDGDEKEEEAASTL